MAKIAAGQRKKKEKKHLVFNSTDEGKVITYAPSSEFLVSRKVSCSAGGVGCFLYRCGDASQ